jgi:hypothetical protein
MSYYALHFLIRLYIPDPVEDEVRVEDLDAVGGVGLRKARRSWNMMAAGSPKLWLSVTPSIHTHSPRTPQWRANAPWGRGVCGCRHRAILPAVPLFAQLRRCTQDAAETTADPRPSDGPLSLPPEPDVR